MWAVDSPKYTAEQVAKSCANGIRKPEVRAALLNAVSTLTANSAAYQASACSHELHLAVAETYVAGQLSDKDMHWIYAQRLARARTPGRKIYNGIMQLAPDGLCVYCQYGRATTLDHFLPKALFAALSIEPWNLVPCCADCNHKIGESWSADPCMQMLHPYFMPDLGRWLRARVRQSVPAAVEYFIDPDPSLPTELSVRMKYQFEKLRLADIYSIVSSRDLSNLRRQLPKLHLDALGVQAHLLETAELALVGDENSWRGVLHETLGNDDWYCAGGFAY